MAEIQTLPFIKEDKCFLPELVPLQQLPTCAIRKSASDLFLPQSYNFNTNLTPNFHQDKRLEGYSNMDNDEGITLMINWMKATTTSEKKEAGL